MQITRAKSELSLEDAEKIVKIVRGLRESGKTEFDPTVRGSIMIAKTLATLGNVPDKNSEMFRLICQDILTSETSRVGSKTNQEKVRLLVNELIDIHC